MRNARKVSEARQAIVIGAGIGGLAVGIRLQSLGFDTTILEKLSGPGGRAAVRVQDGFTFDMGPTVLTAPHFIEELFALERGKAALGRPDFPADVLRGDHGEMGGQATSRYVKLVPIVPFYRIYFDDSSFFDYDGDPNHTLEQIKCLAPEDVAGYERFHAAARAIFERGFIELGYTYFGDLGTVLRVVPDLLKLDAVRPLFSFVKKYFKSEKMRQVFSFEPLLVGGNPLRVPALYAMIHFVEKTWGVHYAMGGTGALIRALVAKYRELGGEIHYNAEVTRIQVTRRAGKKVATGVALADGSSLSADLIVSNGDYATTYLNLIAPRYRRWNRDLLVKLRRQSMSLFVLYFGFRQGEEPLKLKHHTIILGPRYEELLRDIFERKVLAEDISQYLHVPTLTDPSLAPPGHHAAYTLVPVPHQGSGLDWEKLGRPFAEELITFLDKRGYIPNLRKLLMTSSFITPEYFAGALNSYLGNGFGLEPTLLQSAFFRPHNRSEDVSNLYLVGQGTQPGGGTPSVMMSAKITARLIAKDFRISPAVINGMPCPTASCETSTRSG
jgi:phytoene desaturase